MSPSHQSNDPRQPRQQQPSQQNQQNQQNQPDPDYPATGGVPDGYELRKKKPWYARPAIIIALVLIGGTILVMAGCAALVGNVAREVDDAATELDRSLEATHTLTYEVEGDTSDAHVGYQNTGGNLTQENSVPLPWSKEVTFTGFDVATVTVTSGAFDENATVSCRITYEGETVTENTASGPLASASCSLATNELDAK